MLKIISIMTTIIASMGFSSSMNNEPRPHNTYLKEKAVSTLFYNKCDSNKFIKEFDVLNSDEERAEHILTTLNKCMFGSLKGYLSHIDKKVARDFMGFGSTEKGKLFYKVVHAIEESAISRLEKSRSSINIETTFSTYMPLTAFKVELLTMYNDNPEMLERDLAAVKESENKIFSMDDE
jgi:hypothetical protein